MRLDIRWSIWLFGAGWPLGRYGGMFVVALGPLRWVIKFYRKREADQ